MNRIYCISGLGADARIFANVHIPDTELVHLPWPEPDKHDEISCYAQKIAGSIPEPNPSILGMSFGGMLAVEIAKAQPTKKVAIISSVKTAAELPDVSNTLKFLIKTRLLPVGLAKSGGNAIYERFGANTEEEKHLLRSILDDTDPHFMKWAFRAMLKWRNNAVPTHLLHIHGTADRIISPDKVKPDKWIEGGTHLMIYNRAAEINPVLSAYFRG